MVLVKQLRHISEQQYLEGELISETKHEYIDGEVYAMAGAHRNHVILADNLLIELGIHLKGKPCRPYSFDMKVKVAQNYFYPDAIVDCTDFEGYFTETPIIIIEVLSKSTRQTDKTLKYDLYITIPTLQEYVLIEQDFVEVTVWRRSEHFWKQQLYYLGDEVHFESIDYTISVEDIYQRVKNEDMQEWLAQQAAQAITDDEI